MIATAEPMSGQSPPSVLAQTIERDHSLLAMLQLQCQECLRHGAAKDGGFVLRPPEDDKPGPAVYCDRCANAEPTG